MSAVLPREPVAGPSGTGDTAPPPGSMVDVRGLHVAHGAALALEDVEFAVPAGRTVAVLGANGSGKTTLLRALAGELTPRSGRVVRRGRCAMVPQTDRSRLDYPVSALDVALMGCLPGLAWWRRPGRAERYQARSALATVGLGELEHLPFGTLSGGQRQRALVARALVQDAPLLLLDEPLASVDEVTATRLVDLFEELASKGRSLLIATHDLAHAERCDLVLCLRRRQVAFGPPVEVLRTSALGETFGPLSTLPASDVEAWPQASTSI